MNTKGLGYLVVAFIFTLFGLFVGKSEDGQYFKEKIADAGMTVRSTVLDTAINQGLLDAKSTLFMENPEILDALVQENMFARRREAIKRIQNETVVIPLGKRTWQIQLGKANVVLFETDEGLVLIDSGMAPAGPTIVKAIKSVSDKPLHTLIYTQGHVDHAYGTWALLEEGWTPEIVAHQGIVHQFEKFIQLRNSLTRLMSQPARNNEDIVLPTLTFIDSLELEIGGETFILKHHKGEKDDQLYVWVPNRKTLVSADYMESGLQHIKEQIGALREMEEFDAKYLIPGHGEAFTDTEEIRENLISLADSLESIREQTLAGLNQGVGKREIIESLSNYPSSINAAKVSKSVMKRYSEWTAPSSREQAIAIVEMAGSIDAVVQKAQQLATQNVVLATDLAEWAYLANPENFEAQQCLIDILKVRVIDPSSNTAEKLNYIDLMAEARARQIHSRNQ